MWCAEMVEAMKKLAKMDVELSVEERNLFSVGYKNVVGSRRASWRILSSIEQKEESKGNELNVKRIKEYRQKVEVELSDICNDIMIIIDEHLIPSTNIAESTVFYYKMYVYFLIGSCCLWGYLIKCFCFCVRFWILKVILSICLDAGKVIIIGIWRNSKLVMKRKRWRICHWKHIRYLQFTWSNKVIVFITWVCFRSCLNNQVN